MNVLSGQDLAERSEAQGMRKRGVTVGVTRIGCLRVFELYVFGRDERIS